MVNKNKKAVSPVIATILLVMIVIILAIIILLWTTSFVKEAITKEVGGDKKNVKIWCEDVGNNMKTYIAEDGRFGFTNEGNIPIYSVRLKITEGGTAKTVEVAPDMGGLVNPGFNTYFKVDANTYYNYAGGDGYSVKIIPVLLGEKKNGAIEPYPCPERVGALI